MHIPWDHPDADIRADLEAAMSIAETQVFEPLVYSRDYLKALARLEERYQIFADRERIMWEGDYA